MKESKDMQEQISQEQREVFEKLVGRAYFDLGDNTGRPYYASNPSIWMQEDEDGWLHDSLPFLTALQTNSTTRVFGLRAPQSYIDAAANFLANFIKNNTALKDFSLLSQGESYPCSKITMYVEYKHPDLKTIRVLSDALAHTTTLESLSLGFESTGCEEVCLAIPEAYMPLMESLRFNRSLTQLRIDYGFCGNTLSRLANILMVNTTLITLSLREDDYLMLGFGYRVDWENAVIGFQTSIRSNSTLTSLALCLPEFRLTQRLKLLEGLLENRSLFLLKLYSTKPIRQDYHEAIKEDDAKKADLDLFIDTIFKVNRSIGKLVLNEESEKIEKYCSRNQQYQKVDKLEWLLAFIRREVKALSKELNNQIPNVMYNCVRDIIQLLPDTFSERIYRLGYESFRPRLALADWPMDIARPLLRQYPHLVQQGSSSSFSNSTEHKNGFFI